MRMYFRMLKFTKGNIPLFAAAIGCMLISSLFSGVSLGMIVPLIDKIFAGKDIILPDMNRVPSFIRELVVYINMMPRGRLLNGMIMIMLGMMVIKETFLFLQKLFMNRFGLIVVRDVENKVYNRIITLSMDYFHRNKTGVLMSRIKNDAAFIRQSISEGLAELFYQPIQLLVYFGILLSLMHYFAISWRFVGIIVLLIPVIIYPVHLLGRKLRKITIKRQMQSADIYSILFETISGINIVKAFSMEEYETKKFAKANNKLYRIVLSSVKRTLAVSPITELAGTISVAVILWFGGKEVIYGSLSPGAFVAFLAALLSLIKPFKRLSKVHTINQQALGAASRVFELLDERPSVIETASPTEVKEFNDKLSFENVSFSYNAIPVLKGINLEVKKGEIIAFVGPSGVGKTTFVNLIPRFYDPVEGRLLLDGVDIREISLKSLRDQIGIVTQETILFNDTVAANINYGSSDIKFEDIVNAAKTANADDFIRKFAEGYNAYIGDKGMRISGGQRQRLSIARAVLKNPPILILDEATSQLDTESELLVQQAIDNLMQHRTVFVIAHRLSTIKHADRIVVLDQGSIVAAGTHNELLAKGGLYKRLYEMQFR